MTDKAKLFFTKEHEWVELVNDDYVRIGISDYAVEQLGDIVFVELPELKAELSAEDEFATVESVKSTSEIYAPVAGSVAKVNSALEDEPEKLNEAPFGEGWLIEIQASEAVDVSGLMDSSAYEEYVSSL
ncbi:glycine cleavage system protein GcvH [Alkalibacterium olivapovliticus]|uniref:Glycine cleavage system H protein n=1 Tax=Alkalibacterium olivapovliticus TaxID=99907 RepID=A0A2T0W7V8_9LACT|nr:glycine cleavage system protein GcvH [Alkalibacterium olivapovliticus]PRY82772.1 glycine cleavage system H protein [Alkalibacterium olivapovliticus]